MVYAVPRIYLSRIVLHTPAGRAGRESEFRVPVEQNEWSALDMLDQLV
jgi:hypothetical protein